MWWAASAPGMAMCQNVVVAIAKRVFELTGSIVPARSPAAAGPQPLYIGHRRMENAKTDQVLLITGESGSMGLRSSINWIMQLWIAF